MTIHRTLPIGELSKAFSARYTEKFVKELAARGNPTLTAIPRTEDFDGNCKQVRFEGEFLTITRAHDYERPRFYPAMAEMWAACDAAIIALGARLEGCLLGKPSAKTFAGEDVVDGGVTPIGRWGGSAILHCLGSSPRALDADGVVLYRRRGDDVDYDKLEARFGYYANTGPA